MCSGTGITAPRSRPPICPLPVDSPATARYGHPEKLLEGRSPRMVIENARPFVETPRVPRVQKAELLEVEMMTEFVAEGAQEGAERSDFLANRSPRPDAN